MRVLKGNPMHTALTLIKIAAQHFEHWRQPDKLFVAALTNKPFIVDMANFVARVPTPASAVSLPSDVNSQGDRDPVRTSSSSVATDASDLGVYGVRSALLLVDHRSRS